ADRPLRHRLRHAEGRPVGADQLRRLRSREAEDRTEGESGVQADRRRAAAVLHAGVGRSSSSGACEASVSKDGHGKEAFRASSWFETAQERLLTMRMRTTGEETNKMSARYEELKGLKNIGQK